MTAPNAKQHRKALLQTAIWLFRRQGYAATGLSQILKMSGAPKGSLYYYFPGGKEELGAAAVNAASQTVLDTLLRLEEKTGTADEFLSSYCTMLSEWTAKSDYADGCPISTTLLEMAPASTGITEAGQIGFASWKDVFIRVLKRDGMADAPAQDRATLIMAGLQGALLLSRVEQSSAPFDALRQLTR